MYTGDAVHIGIRGATMTHLRKQVPAPPHDSITPTEAAYIAGIIDGEGCVSVATRLGKYITPTVQVSNTNQGLLRWLFELYGGNIDTRRDPRPTRKQCNTWRVAGEKARRVLRDILPYLRIKKRHAELALSWEPNRVGSHWHLTDADVLRNQRIIAEIRQLNQRGVQCP